VNDELDPLLVRIHRKVSIVDDDCCWLWQGTHDSRGKPRIKVAGKSEYTYRVCWQIAHGQVAKGAVIAHPCPNPNCVNPHDHPTSTPPA
jgi:hypothetical protein